MPPRKTPGTAAAATPDAKMLEIPSINLKDMLVTIHGITDLITHRFGERAMQQMESKQQKEARGAKEPRVPDAEFRDALYVIDERNEIYGFPAAGVKKALVNAGGRFTDEHMTVLRGVININGDLLPIATEGPPHMRRDPVRLAGGVSSIAYRPAFSDWSMDVPVRYNASMISKEQVLNLFQIAGFSIGLGDWRPEKNGVFGQFRVGEALVEG